MDIGEVAGHAVDAVARQLTTGAERAGSAAVDQVYRLLSQRLRRTSWGARVLDGLERDPGSPERRQQTVEAVVAEARQDPSFFTQLDRLTQGIFVQGAGARYSSRVSQVDRSRHYDQSGDQRDIRISGSNNRVKMKKYHIGSVRFGTGGLVSGIAVLVVALGGGGAAIYGSQKAEPKVAEAVGKWHRDGAKIGPATEDPYDLSVDGDGRFTFTFGAKIDMPPAPKQEMHVKCAGTVTTAGDHLSLRASSGGCADMTAKPVDGGKALEIGGLAKDGQPVTLAKAG
ncbi:hypothetical protein SD37_40690 [Amycolatopsis orientalis]|uniref:Uncharacterized protein n=1 Tax=Amycolatopsis orientalis TaxID=31958 RepID=A0A193C9Z9_AMYOR|nr:hypothetical protein [Amycolatopsis orientalis]ANN21274.1 hypothetical protein SD37_40690 [Amycolatopsis orientalis]